MDEKEYNMLDYQLSTIESWVNAYGTITVSSDPKATDIARPLYHLAHLLFSSKIINDKLFKKIEEEYGKLRASSPINSFMEAVRPMFETLFEKLAEYIGENKERGDAEKQSIRQKLTQKFKNLLEIQRAVMKNVGRLAGFDFNYGAYKTRPRDFRLCDDCANRYAQYYNLFKINDRRASFWIFLTVVVLPFLVLLMSQIW